MTKKEINIKGKVCLLGDHAVGKTSLIRRYVLDVFKDEYISTIGTKITKKTTTLFENDDSDTIKMTLLIWDIVGDVESLPEIINSYNRYSPQLKHFKDAKGGIVVCDISRKNTFKSLTNWILAFKDVAGDVPLLFIGNKSDLQPIAMVSKSDLNDIAVKNNSNFFLTSAKTGENVENVFADLAMTIAKPYI
jgi:small GTP-binding protein